jgi:penicillin-binding protein 1A
VVSVKILEEIGVSAAIEYAKKLGIVSSLANNLTLALGSSSLTPMELTSAYAVFASGGYRATPYFVTRVLDRDGNVLEEVAEPKLPVFTGPSSASVPPGDNDDEGENPLETPPQPIAQPQASAFASTLIPVISPEIAYVMTNLLESVVTSGTGGRARALGRPVAGKTGTTNDMKDAWFIGYVPQLVAGVWVGYDQERSLGSGGSGGQAAAPIWTEFMQRALAGVPVKQFAVPRGVTFALINPRTGHLAREGSPGAVRECFIGGSEPTSYDPETPASPTPVTPVTPGISEPPVTAPSAAE